MCVLTECGLVPSRRAISFRREVFGQRSRGSRSADRSAGSRCAPVPSGHGRDTDRPMRAPNASLAAPRTSTGTERPRLAPLASSSAGPLERRAALGMPDHLVLEALEEELSPAARAQRLIG